MIAEARRTLVLDDSEGKWTGLGIFDELLKDPWVRHAAEIEVAKDGIERASNSLSRFVKLRHILTNYKLGQESTSYLREVIDTYLLGFDAASIALCGAMMEQILREIIASKGLMSQGELRNSRPTGLSLLETINRKKQISRSGYAAAKCIMAQRNIVMHRHLGRHETLQDLALELIGDLGSVLIEMGNEPEVLKN